MDTLTFEKEGQVGILRVNRPQQLNALNRQVLEELNDFLLNRIEKEGIRTLIFTGSGEKAFIAGADIKEMLALEPIEMVAFAELGQRVSLLLERAPCLTIAAVNGFALGGGLEMALACDFIYASQRAKMGLPEVTLGLIPGFGGTYRLARAVGTRRAKELITTGRFINAEQAEQWGLVNKVCDPDSLLDEVMSVAKEANRNSFYAVRQAKDAINHGAHLPPTEALELEKNMCAVCFSTADRLEGMTAFVEKREPVFQ
jgi:enoyl-CoA hydratase